jgi:hypothetical protein
MKTIQLTDAEAFYLVAIAEKLLAEDIGEGESEQSPKIPIYVRKIETTNGEIVTGEWDEWGKVPASEAEDFIEELKKSYAKHETLSTWFEFTTEEPKE